jgi:hypothetical protein
MMKHKLWAKCPKVTEFLPGFLCDCLVLDSVIHLLVICQFVLFFLSVLYESIIMGVYESIWVCMKVYGCV